MTCTDCQPEIERFGIAAGQPSGRVELCPKHAMVEKLAVALRELYDGFPKVDSRSERAQCVLREYDSEHGLCTRKASCTNNPTSAQEIGGQQ